MSGPYRVGVDVGGTFSDFVVLDEASGAVRVLKVPSTPADPWLAVLAGVARLAPSGVAPAGRTLFSRATTLAPKPLHAEEGARSSLLATPGLHGIYEVHG